MSAANLNVRGGFVKMDVGIGEFEEVARSGANAGSTRCGTGSSCPDFGDFGDTGGMILSLIFRGPAGSSSLEGGSSAGFSVVFPDLV